VVDPGVSSPKGLLGLGGYGGADMVAFRHGHAPFGRPRKTPAGGRGSMGTVYHISAGNAIGKPEKW
jgi:hypothetical protein